MRCIDTLSATELKGKRVLLRADFNVPISRSGEVADVFRLEQGWKSVQYLAERGAKVIIISHIGREPTDSLEPVSHAIQKYGHVVFIPDITGAAAQGAVAAMKDGEILLLENVRRDPRESANDESFARELAALAELFVVDGFAVAHRAQASVVGVAKFLPAYAGLLLRDEIEHIDEARDPAHPSLAILGGAKFETKAPLVQLLLEKYDRLFITGALANDVFKARGLPTGRSLISKELPNENVLTNPRLFAPIDVTAQSSDGQAKVKKPEDVGADDKIVDAGPDTVAMLAPHIEGAQFILWNGPTGVYEEGFNAYTHQLAELIARANGRGAKVVIGGGDTIAAIEGSGVSGENLGFLSTGGGAMLEYLLKGSLPGVDIVK